MYWFGLQSSVEDHKKSKKSLVYELVDSAKFMCHRLNEYERSLLLLAALCPTVGNKVWWLLLLAIVEELNPAADDKLLFVWRFKDPTREEKHFMVKAIVVTDC